MSIDVRLAEIEARAKATTPGPWKITANPDFYVMSSHDFVARMILTGKNGKPWGQKDKQQVFEDMCFIGHSRADIPRLVAALRVAVEAIQRETETARTWGRTMQADRGGVDMERIAAALRGEGK